MEKLSRRGFAACFAGALLGVLLALGTPRLGRLLLRGRRWYEVVQDMKDPRLWHVNLFSSPKMGDLEKAERLGYRVVEASDVKVVLGELEYPARVQFRDGHREQAL